MDLYFHRTPKWLQNLYPGLTWKKDDEDKSIYLTFDDGPIPEVTEFVLKQLKIYQAHATFFCVGHNIEKHSQQFDDVLEEGHAIGNHTFNHLVGWNSTLSEYLQNVELCQHEIEKHTGVQSRKFFRPPHGRITKQQIKHLQQEYEIIMWTYLSGDFDRNLSEHRCFEKMKLKSKTQDIIVFHDSIKAYKSLQYTLPKILDHYTKLEYSFKSL